MELKSKGEEPRITRRQAIGIVGALGAAALGIKLYERTNELLEEQEKRISPEQLANLESAINERVKKIDEGEKQFQEQLAKAKAEVAPLFEKYGTPENPKLFIRAGYKPEATPHFELSTKEKDARFRELLGEMYECGTVLESYATMHATEPVLTKLETALKTDQSQVTDMLSTRTGLQLANLAQRLVQEEVMVLGEKFYALDRGFIWGKLKRAEPSTTSNTGQEKIHADIDPILRKIVKGYPEVWPKVRFLEKEEYAKVAPEVHSTEGFYKWSDDAIVCETPGTWIKLILNYAHEAGHATDGLSAIRATCHMQKVIAEGQKEYRTKRDALQSLKKAVSDYGASPTKTNRDRIFTAHTAVELTNIGNRLAHTSQNMRKLLDTYSQFSGVDEACAYLFEGMVAEELARTHPAGEWITAHRQLRRVSSEGLHKTAYDFAEKLVKEKGGLRQAWDYLVNCPEEERDTIEQRIHDETPIFFTELARQEATGGSLRQLTHKFEQHWAKGKELTQEEADKLQDKLLTALKAYGEYSTVKLLRN